MRATAASAIFGLLAAGVCEAKQAPCLFRVQREVVGFQVDPAGHSTSGVVFQWNDHGRLALDSLSVERRGAFLFVFINGVQ